MVYLADSHAHLVDKAYEGDREEVIKRAADNSLKLIISLGYDLKTSYAALNLAERYDFLYTAVGVHPHCAKSVPLDYRERLKELASREKVVAVGEIGLDYYRDLSPRKKQQEIFREQLRLAQEVRLPVIIHDRDAHQDVLNIIKEEAGGRYGGVIHCFSGDWEMAAECMELGFYISIAGPVTFKNSETLQDVARKLPLDRILVETDSPFLSPVPFRGRRNEPVYVKLTVEKIAALRGMRWEDVAQATFENTRRVFKV